MSGQEPSNRELWPVRGAFVIERVRGFAVVVSAPSGAGKTTICRRIVADMPDTHYSVSVTTRSPRPGEVDGRDYHFVSEAEFRSRIRDGRLVEWAEVHGNYYGTDRRMLEERLERGQIVLLDLDVQGARNLKRALPDTVTVFICPPSWEALEHRLRGRAADSEETVRLRLANARREMSAYRNYDYLVRNDELERATRRVRGIIESEARRVSRVRLKGWDDEDRPPESRRTEDHGG